MKQVKALFEVPTCYHIRDKLASLLNPVILLNKFSNASPINFEKTVYLVWPFTETSSQKFSLPRSVIHLVITQSSEAVGWQVEEVYLWLEMTFVPFSPALFSCVSDLAHFSVLTNFGSLYNQWKDYCRYNRPHGLSKYS